MSKQPLRILFVISLLTLSIALPVSASQPTARRGVAIVDFKFKPATITVHVGDLVGWKNLGQQQHTTTSNTGVWDSGVLNSGQIFFRTFSTAGTFAYHCSIHPFMTGTIVVLNTPTPIPTTPCPDGC